MSAATTTRFGLLLGVVALFVTPRFLAGASLTSVWTNAETGGQVVVVSAVDELFTTWTYTVRNISYNPPGGDGNYGVQHFNLGNEVPPHQSLFSPLGWTIVDLPGVAGARNWFRDSVLNDPVDPNRPNVGLLPGQSATFGFTLDVSNMRYDAVPMEGSVASTFHQVTNGFVFRDTSTFSTYGQLLFPRLVLAKLTVTTNGNGMVSRGFLGSTFRKVGRPVSIAAIPKPGFLFSNWTGSVVQRPTRWCL